jgi:hypothetical protein
VPERNPSSTADFELPSGIIVASRAAIGVGTLGTGVGLILGHHREETWWMLLVNFLFWTGLAQGMFVWSSIFRTVQATWTPALNRLGHAAVNFQPFSLGLFGLLVLGRGYWLTWLHHPVPEKSVWLNAPFFFARNALALTALMGLSYFLLRRYRQGETAASEEQDQVHHRINVVATALVGLYALVYSLLAFDLIMSLTPHWYSTLFGGYFFVSNLYLALAGLIILATLLRRCHVWAQWLGPGQFRDLGNLLMGFGLLTTGLFFAQFLTIWYGNLPEETAFILPRLYASPWKAVGFSLLGTCYLGPFLLLLSPQVKSNPCLLCPIALLVVAAMWVERWMLIVPSFSPHRLAGLGLLQGALPLLCAGVLTWAVGSSLQRHPQVSPLDLALELEEGVSL